jgi:hypothetical protein
MLIYLTRVLAILLMSCASYASASSITFDDLANYQWIGSGYAGLNWSNFAALDADIYSLPSGFQNGTVSHSNVAFNSGGDDASFSAANHFIFNSAYITAGWNNGLNVQVTGFLNGAQTHSSLLTVSTSGPTLAVFNWSNVDLVSFHAFGGIKNPDFVGTGGQHFALDNLTINAVPEPETYAMLLAGLGMVGMAARRRKQSEA